MNKTHGNTPTPAPLVSEPIPAHITDPEFVRDPDDKFWITDERVGEVLAIVVETGHGEAAANAPLLAAAPLLLNAARHAIPYLEAAAPFFMFQTSHDFYPNREQIEAIVVELREAVQAAERGK